MEQPEEEREETLAERLDRELNEFIDAKTKEAEEKRKQPGYVSEKDKDIETILKEVEGHPAFMNSDNFDPSKPLSPLMEGLQSMMYESDDLEDKAENYKTDGNENFKKKKYRWAIDNYTEGIKARCSNRELNAQLYCNRAAAHFHLGNFGSSYKDCIVSRKFKPDHAKAIIRGIQCFLEIKRYDNAIKWCDDALLINPTDAKVLEFRAKAEQLKKKEERDKRKKKAEERKKEAAEKKLLEAIQMRGIRVQTDTGKVAEGISSLTLDSLETKHPSGAKVHVDDNGVMKWPVMFLYPEHTETDFIVEFDETSRFIDQIEVMFGENEDRPPWDRDNKYKPADIEVYFEEIEKEILHKVNPMDFLHSVLSDKRLLVRGGTPAFILLVKDSPFQKHFLKRYSK